jgi:hypothetical protein
MAIWIHLDLHVHVIRRCRRHLVVVVVVVGGRQSDTTAVTVVRPVMVVVGRWGWQVVAIVTTVPDVESCKDIRREDLLDCLGNISWSEYVSLKFK